MKRLFHITLSLLAAMVLATACDEDAKYVAPQGVQIQLTPNPCSPGEIVTAAITYSDPGENWYWYETTSKFSFKASDSIRAYGQQVMGTSKTSTFCQFIMPDSLATYKIRFTGQITITAGKDLWGDRIECEADLVVR